MSSVGPRRPVALALSALACATSLGLSACASRGTVATDATAVPSPRVTAAPDPSSAPAATTAKPPATPTARALPSAHVHAVAREPGTGDVLVATHEGLYVYGKGEPRKVGPTIDLMGFTVAGPGHYYASGHPGPGVDLPQPAGLLESRDGGRSWTVLSRGGSSDFHALAATPERVLGFDGTVRTTTDGRTWETGDLASPPRSLAISPDGRRVLATTADGLMGSDDGGRRWAPMKGAPLLLFVDWAGGQTVAGLSPEGRLHLSTDAGRSWQTTKAGASDIQALDATGSGKTLEVVAATEHRLVTLERLF